MTEKEKEKQTIVEEKRIQPSVIRRRSARVPKKPPVEVAAEAEQVETSTMPQAPEQAPPQPQLQAEPPAQHPVEAVPEVLETTELAEPAIAKPDKEDKKPKGKVKKGVPEKKEAPPARRPVLKKAREKSAEEILAELKLEEAEEGAQEKTEDAAVVEKTAVKAEEKPVARKEVKVFQKETELKKFYTAGRPPGRKGKFQQQRGQYGKQRGQTATGRAMKKTEITVTKAAKRVVRIFDAISVADLSQKLGVKAGEIIKKLMGLGIMATVNQLIDFDAVSLIAQDYDYEVESVAVQEESLMEPGHEEAAVGDLKFRAPVVTVMGHVDHGKTSLLDAIRQTNVVSGEAGGITQHIGAYHVHLEKGDVTFLDTPGHEAFTAMRARGARATDIVVLVVAADDGVMPQTIEAINHSKAAGVPIIVAINKIDLPDADSKRIKQELTQFGLVSEDWGGDTIFIEVSAKKGIHIKELLEMILLQSEILELKANPEASARGIVVEAKLDKGRGPVSTVLIQDGTLRVGDALVTGTSYGRIRAMISDWGKRIDEAGPSMPIEILGLSEVPSAGEPFVVVKDEATAKQIATIRQKKSLEKDRLKTARVSLADLYDKITKGEVKELNLILKADVHGSIEAVRETLEKLSTDAVKLKVIHSAVGGISEGDVMLAAASNAIVIGFNVRAEPKAQTLAEKEDVDLRYYTIIYNLVDEIKSAMEGMLSPIVREEVIGKAEIRDVFRVTKVGNVAGCYVIDGKATRGANVRLIRDNVVIYDGKLSSLKRFKDDVKEVATGYECGMTIEGYNDIKEGDVIELYTLKEEAAKL
ncbi:MAG: translation initiation factor IF-2 [Deltaproteobacteria bacterium RBG_19FT_COMBO_58_16]|nr:MAG: translation initiation factor IF-2 [Deltaproteobacteria bacterium RBG_19FT_COMBO_58_16]